MESLSIDGSLQLAHLPVDMKYTSCVFVASGFEWFTASRSIAVESYLTRIVKDTSERAKKERERKRVGAEHLPPRVRRNYAHTCLYMVGPKTLNRNCW